MATYSSLEIDLPAPLLTGRRNAAFCEQLLAEMARTGMSGPFLFLTRNMCFRSTRGWSLAEMSSLDNEVPGVHVTPEIMERMRVASVICKEAGRDEGLKVAREYFVEVPNPIQGVQVSAPFGNVKYAL